MLHINIYTIPAYSQSIWLDTQLEYSDDATNSFHGGTSEPIILLAKIFQCCADRLHVLMQFATLSSMRICFLVSTRVLLVSIHLRTLATLRRGAVADKFIDQNCSMAIIHCTLHPKVSTCVAINRLILCAKN